MYTNMFHVYLYLRNKGLKPVSAWQHAMKAYKLHGR